MTKEAGTRDIAAGGDLIDDTHIPRRHWEAVLVCWSRQRAACPVRLQTTVPAVVASSQIRQIATL
jgi:hypothetical protein